MSKVAIGTKGAIKPQLGIHIFESANTRMKNLLKMAEYKYENRNSDGFKFYKSEVMDQFYPMLEEIFQLLEKLHVVEKCGCGNSVHLRNGWSKECGWCRGSGYRNHASFNDFLFEEHEAPFHPEQLD